MVFHVFIHVRQRSLAVRVMNVFRPDMMGRRGLKLPRGQTVTEQRDAYKYTNRDVNRLEKRRAAFVTLEFLKNILSMYLL